MLGDEGGAVGRRDTRVTMMPQVDGFRTFHVVVHQPDGIISRWGDYHCLSFVHQNTCDDCRGWFAVNQPCTCSHVQNSFGQKQERVASGKTFNTDKTFTCRCIGPYAARSEDRKVFFGDSSDTQIQTGDFARLIQDLS